MCDQVYEGESLNGVTISFVTNSTHTLRPCVFTPADGGMESGKHFWEFQFKNASGESYVGVSLKDEPFKHVTGAFYGGHGGFLSAQEYGKIQFGETIRGDDKVGLYLELDNEEFKMYIFHNDRPLGLAFYNRFWYRKPIFPAIIFVGNGSVTITKQDHIPTDLEFKPQYGDFGGYFKVDECITSQSSPKLIFNDTKKYACQVVVTKFDKLATESKPEEYRISCRLQSLVTMNICQKDSSWKLCGHAVGLNIAHKHADKEVRKKLEECILYNFIYNNEVIREGESLVLRQKQMEGWVKMHAEKPPERRLYRENVFGFKTKDDGSPNIEPDMKVDESKENAASSVSMSLYVIIWLTISLLIRKYN
ncbi:hypothetical protein B4U79_16587 [Dinothrombium tinctorium]|uniref:B30.2/SPRY domain-containing protein n=1 Tax=Dinothrombium tinctorium TaxID=1965070 RepID=A0A443QI86_9ACAR|nr:hypothetical protein B4U79_16587 [Dinothrombium tinctorium]